MFGNSRRPVTLVAIAAALLFLGACVQQAKEKTIEDNIVVEDTLRRAAVEAEENRNYLAAFSHYQKLWTTYRSSEQLFLGMVRNLRYLGSAKEAVRAMLENEESFGKSLAYRLEYAKSLIAADRSRDAVSQLVTAIDLKHDDWRIYATMGIAYDRLQIFRSAREAYEMGLELSPENPAILNNMAISAAMNGDIKGAIAIVNRASRADRNNVQIRQNLALFLGIGGDLKHAEALARMDLDEDSVRNNLSVFQSLRRK